TGCAARPGPVSPTAFRGRRCSRSTPGWPAHPPTSSIILPCRRSGDRASAPTSSLRVDAPAFTLGRLPDAPGPLQRAQETATRLDQLLVGRRMREGEAGRALGVNPNMLKYGTATGRIRIRWDGAHQPTVWTVAPPEMEPMAARLELARRFL